MVARIKHVFIGVRRGKRVFKPVNTQVQGKPYIRQYSDGRFHCTIALHSTVYHGYGRTAMDAYLYCKQQTIMLGAWMNALDLDCPPNPFKPKRHWWQFWR